MDKNLSELIDSIKDATEREALVERLARDYRWSRTTVLTYLVKGKLAEMAHMRGAQLVAAELEPATHECVTIGNGSRYTRAFALLAMLIPRRIWNEDVGDALETICAMERAGCSRLKVRLKIASTYFWVLIAVVRELVAALTGRKSPHQ